MAFWIEAREGAAAEWFVLDILHDLRSGGFGSRKNLIRVLHDQAYAAGLRTAQFRRQFHVAVGGFVIDRAQHDHAAAERQFGVHDGVARAGIHGVLFESEDATEPFDGIRRVTIMHPWNRGAAGGCLVRHAYSMAERARGVL